MKPRQPDNRNLDSGSAAERAASIWLQQHGLRLVEANFSYKGGEVDLIMRDGAELVFVEVRLRSRSDFGDAAESVTPAKQRRIIRAAQYFLLMHPRWRNSPCRFDVLAAAAPAPGNVQWRWFRHAFLTEW